MVERSVLASDYDKAIEALRHFERMLTVYQDLPTDRYPGPPGEVLIQVRAVLASTSAKASKS